MDLMLAGLILPNVQNGSGADSDRAQDRQRATSDAGQQAEATSAAEEHGDLEASSKSADQ